MQDVPMQTSMQAAFAPWSMVEKWLRKAHEVSLPISISGLYGLDEVRKVVRDRQQVRDIVTAFHDKEMALKMDLPMEQRSENNRDRIGFIWNPEFKGEPYRPTARMVTRNAQKPSKAQTHVHVPHKPTTHTKIHADVAMLKETPKAVELIFQGVTLTISRSENGNARIVIE